MLVTKTRCYQTRLGRPVRIYDLWSSSLLPVIGAVKGRYEWELQRWHQDGRLYGPGVDSPFDLEEVECEKKGETNAVEFENSYNCH